MTIERFTHVAIYGDTGSLKCRYYPSAVAAADDLGGKYPYLEIAQLSKHSFGLSDDLTHEWVAYEREGVWQLRACPIENPVRADWPQRDGRWQMSCRHAWAYPELYPWVARLQLDYLSYPLMSDSYDFFGSIDGFEQDPHRPPLHIARGYWLVYHTPKGLSDEPCAFVSFAYKTDKRVDSPLCHFTMLCEVGEPYQPVFREALLQRRLDDVVDFGSGYDLMTRIDLGRVPEVAPCP